jgi:hypothetical protein
MKARAVIGEPDLPSSANNQKPTELIFWFGGVPVPKASAVPYGV